MHILFIHDAFPAQFGRLGLELTERYGWRCSYLIQSLSACPTPTRAMLEKLEIHQVPLSQEHRQKGGIPWPQIYGLFLEQCRTVYDVLRTKPELKPDLVVAHGGRGAPTLFLSELFDCPIVIYCEYYFGLNRRDISYRIDLPPAEPAPFFPRSINAPTLATLVEADTGYSATHWQRASFPKRFQHKIEVHFDGIDTTEYQPGPAVRQFGGVSIPEGTRVVTYVARGLESVRGFDIFMKAADRIGRARSDVLFIVVGGEEIHYGWDALHTGRPSFKQWVLEQDKYDLSRFLFLGTILPEQLAQILRLTDLHIYPSVPFVLSWSLLDAMCSGAVVIGSDVPPVREVIEPGVNGLVTPFFDVDQLADTALRVLGDPAAFAPLGRAARRTIEERYSLDVAIPALKDYFERIAAQPARKGVTAPNHPASRRSG